PQPAHDAGAGAGELRRRLAAGLGGGAVLAAGAAAGGGAGGGADAVLHLDAHDAAGRVAGAGAPGAVSRPCPRVRSAGRPAAWRRDLAGVGRCGLSGRRAGAGGPRAAAEPGMRRLRPYLTGAAIGALALALVPLSGLPDPAARPGESRVTGWF